MRKFLLAIILNSVFLIFNSQAQSPSFLLAKSIGSSGAGEGYAIATDDSGNVYSTGYFSGTMDFDPDTTVTFSLTSGGNNDVFITKFDSTGHLLWAKNVGGSGDEYSEDIALDAFGNVYTTGSYQGPADFDPGAGVFNLNQPNQRFILKLDNAGNFIWAKEVGGVTLGIDGAGNIYTSASFGGTIDCDPGAGTYNLTSVGAVDMYVCKLDASGNFIWAKSMGGTNSTYSFALTLDANANVYTTGNYSGTTDFDPGAGTSNLITSGTGSNIFISKIDSAGNFVWARGMDGDADANGRSISTDPEGNVCTSGFFFSTVDFDPGAGTFNLSSPLRTSAFISKLDDAGNFVWAKEITGSANVFGYALAHDDLGNLYCSGYFYATADLNPDPLIADSVPSAGGADIFLTKLDSSGNLVWAKNMGGASDDVCLSLSVGSAGNLFLGGTFLSNSLLFDPIQLFTNDSTFFANNFYVAKLGTCSADFSVYPDITPHNWLALNEATGVTPITYSWDWGDGNNSSGATPSHTYSTPGYYNICLSITDAKGCISSYCDSSTYLNRPNGNNTIININVVTQLPTGIQEQQSNENEVSVYPNPATSAFTIYLGNYSNRVDVTITDLEGKTIFVADSKGENKFNVNTKDFAVGIYAIRIQSADFIETRKLIINK